jgi:fructose-1,6-bisphosphatase I
LSFVEVDAGSGGLVVVATPLDCGAGMEGADPSACAGSVFAVYEATPSRGELALGVIPCGQRSLAASGYCVYSSSTQLVLAVKGGAPNAFTLDPATQTFVCSEEGLRVPSTGKTLVVDYGCAPGWPRPLQDFVHDATTAGLGGKPFGSRFSGSTVADVHRIISTGGCFCHSAAPGCGPGLPFLSMAAPLAFVAEHAGGRVLCRGTTEESTSLSASSPLYLGSETVISALAGYLDRAPAPQKEISVII